MTEDSLPALHRFLLTTIRKEGPIMASVLKSDLRTMARGGCDMTNLDENRVFRTLEELEAAGLVVKTLGGYLPVFVAEVVQAKQGSLFA